jgi:hypothetical protein
MGRAYGDAFWDEQPKVPHRGILVMNGSREGLIAITWWNRLLVQVDALHERELVFGQFR